MSEMFRHCPECGAEQLFVRHHDSSCPDAGGGECPEWMCTGCGAALLEGFAPRAGWRHRAEPSGRVA